jgi:hypothetical protein
LQDFVNQRYFQNNASQNAGIAHIHTADFGLNCNGLVCCTGNSVVYDKGYPGAPGQNNKKVG